MGSSSLGVVERLAGVEAVALAGREWPHRTVRLDGVELCVREVPDAAEDADPVLFVHGLGGSSLNFTAIGRGVTVVKTADDDHVIGFVAGEKGTVLRLENAAGKDFSQTALVKELTSRGGKGHQLQKRTTFNVPKPTVTIPSLGTPGSGSSTTEGK